MRLAIVVALLVACAVGPADTAAEAGEIVTNGSVSPLRVVEGRLLLIDVWRYPIVEAHPTDPQLELFDLLVECALPLGDTLVLDLDSGPKGALFFGEIGLVTAWRHRGLSHEERRWISACVLSKLSHENVVTPFAMRGERHQLARVIGERALYTLEEGAFFGDLFGPELRWAACAGRNRVPDRDCAREDPTRPGLTLCGLTYVGSCRRACERHGDHFVECREHREIITAYGAP